MIAATTDDERPQTSPVSGSRWLPAAVIAIPKHAVSCYAGYQVMVCSLQVLVPAILLTGLLTVTVRVRGHSYAVYVFKPLTTLLVLVLAATTPEPVSRFYQTAVVVRLAFSLAGDALLMLPRQLRWMLPGAICFLMAHLVYLPALSAIAGFSVTLPLMIPFALYAAAWIVALWPNLGRLRWSIALYAVVLTSTGWLAAEQVLQSPEPRVVIVMVAMICFILSDSVLAYDRFIRHSIAREPVVLALYFAAQLLTALTV